MEDILAVLARQAAKKLAEAQKNAAAEAARRQAAAGAPPARRAVPATRPAVQTARAAPQQVAQAAPAPPPAPMPAPPPVSVAAPVVEAFAVTPLVLPGVPVPAHPSTGLLSAFGSSGSLLAGIVLAEALAPPVSQRGPQLFERLER